MLCFCWVIVWVYYKYRINFEGWWLLWYVIRVWCQLIVFFLSVWCKILFISRLSYLHSRSIPQIPSWRLPYVPRDCHFWSNLGRWCRMSPFCSHSTKQLNEKIYTRIASNYYLGTYSFGLLTLAYIYDLREILREGFYFGIGLIKAMHDLFRWWEKGNFLYFRLGIESILAWGCFGGSIEETLCSG